MEFYQIKYFLAVIEKGNFTRAAQYANVSQPSLTQAIKKLEYELGGVLFLRDRAGCRLTALGRRVEPKLRLIFKTIQETVFDAARFSKLNKMPFRIGIMHTIGSQIIGKSFSQFQTLYPSVEIELFIEAESNLLAMIEAGELDIIITSPLPKMGSEYKHKVLYSEGYYFTFSSDHPFNKKNQIGLDDLKTQAYLDRLNCEFRDDLTHVCSKKNIELDSIYRSNNEQWILDMARLGAGVALMPEYSLPEKNSGFGTKPLTNPEIRRDVFAIYSLKAQYQNEIDTMLRCLAEY